MDLPLILVSGRSGEKVHLVTCSSDLEDVRVQMLLARAGHMGYVPYIKPLCSLQIHRITFLVSFGKCLDPGPNFVSRFMSLMVLRCFWLPRRKIMRNHLALF